MPVVGARRTSGEGLEGEGVDKDINDSSSVFIRGQLPLFVGWRHNPIHTEKEIVGNQTTGLSDSVPRQVSYI